MTINGRTLIKVENLYKTYDDFHALAGISVCVVALILDAILSMWKKGVKDIPCVVICAAAFVISAFTSFSPILLVISCAVVGILAALGWGRKAPIAEPLA